MDTFHVFGEPSLPFLVWLDVSVGRRLLVFSTLQPASPCVERPIWGQRCRTNKDMPPKKKQKVSKASAASASRSATPSKPVSSSRSTRSRTRSVSVAPAAPLASASATTTTAASLKEEETSEPCRSEPGEAAGELAEDNDQILSPVWDGNEQPQMECWVEIPAASIALEDKLLFIRPKDKEALKAKGKHREVPNSKLWLVDQRPPGSNPFHFSEQDLQDDANADAQHLVALRPSAATGHGITPTSESTSASARPTHSQPPADPKGPEQSTSASAVQAEVSSSRAQSNPAVGSQQNLTSRQPANDVLEDLFLGSNDASTSSQPWQEQAAPLFFQGATSDDEDQLRNGLPAAASMSRRPVIKQSPTSGDRMSKLSSDHRSRSRSPQSTEPSSSSHDKETASKQNEEKGKRTREEEDQKRRQEATRISSPDIVGASRKKRNRDDVKNLRSELNEDAFTRSTGARHKEEYRNKLAAFAQARKKAKQDRGESISDSSDDSEEDDVIRSKPKLKLNGKRANTVSSGSESSDSSENDSDDESDSSSDSDDSKDFIVADDQVEYDEGFQPEEDSVSKPKVPAQLPSQALSATDRRRFQRDSDGRIHLVPIFDQTSAAAASSTSILAAHGLGRGDARKGLDELCLDWLEWAVARVLVTWSALCLPDRERLERNRAALQSRMRSLEHSVGSVAMRRQFKWYLTQYPKISIEALFSDEVDRFGSLAKQGCGICHRVSQKPQFRVTLAGLRYNQQTLAPLNKRNREESGSSSDSSSSGSSSSASDDDSDESDTASDRSSDTETWCEEGTDSLSRPTYTFFAGSHCAQRAAVMHGLHHWEWATMQTLAKHESIRYIRRQLWRKSRQGKGKDGKMGAGAYEVAFCVSEMISPTGRCKWKSKRDKERGSSELERLRKRLKTLERRAIDVNRAR